MELGTELVRVLLKRWEADLRIVREDACFS